MLSSLLVLALVSPAHAEAPQADPAWGRIVNGREVKGDNFPAAVAIGVEIPMAGQERMAFCSASLITPRLLLTAGHCTEEVAAQYRIPKDMLLRVGAAFFTNDVSRPNTRSVPWADYRVHPQYSSSGQSISNDIGVIELAEPVTDIAPVWFRDTPLTDDEAVGHEVTSVGFGVTSSAAQNSSGIKRVAELIVSFTDDQFLYSMAANNPNNANVCSGDSGGPQYAMVDGAWEQWGVHSFVFATSGRQDPCQVASASTDVSAYAPWILKQIERVHGTTDRCAINDQYEDRVCDAHCDEPDPDCEMDLDGDGLVTDDEVEAWLKAEEKAQRRANRDCHQGGGAPWLALPALLALGLRRRR